MKYLGFNVKRNLKKAPKIYVKSADLKVNYGAFSADQPSQFEGWDQLDENQIIELKHYIQNLNAVKRHLGSVSLNEQTEFRLRLPLNFINTLYSISAICEKASIDFDIYEPILSSIIQQLKISVAKLPKEYKDQALSILDRVGLVEYTKIDYSSQIQAVFSELLSIPNKSEKLHKCAKDLFAKDKSYSPRAIEGMAKGETMPSKWLVACSINVLAEEKPEILKKVLSEDDIFMLLAKPLLDHDQQDALTQLIKKHGFNFLHDRVNQYLLKDSE